MLKNSVIIIPNNTDKKQICDYLEQTKSILERQNQVFVIHFYATQTLKKFFTSGVKNDKWDVFTPIQFLPLNRFSVVKKINKRIYFYVLRFYLKQKFSQVNNYFTWMFFPELFEAVVWNKRPWKVIYDIVDFHYDQEEKTRAIENYQKKYLLTQSDYIFSISHTLKNLYQKKSKKIIHAVPQGFDALSFAQNTQKTKLKLPTGRPIIGLVGQLSQRLDFALLHKVIQQNLQWNFVFVGPLHHEPNVSPNFDKHEIENLFEYPNSFHFSTQPRNTILSVLQKFDVCMIPYDIFYPFNLYCYPMKLFEYFYAQKPIISTPIQELTHFPKVVKIATTSEEWKQKISDLLSHKWTAKQKEIQLDLAIKNSWKNKLDSISQYLE